MLIRFAIILVSLAAPALSLALVDDLSVNQSFHVRIQQEDNPAGVVEDSFNHAGTEAITHELEVLLDEGGCWADQDITVVENPDLFFISGHMGTGFYMMNNSNSNYIYETQSGLNINFLLAEPVDYDIQVDHFILGEMGFSLTHVESGEGPSYAFEGEDIFSATGTLGEVGIYQFEAWLDHGLTSPDILDYTDHLIFSVTLTSRVSVSVENADWDKIKALYR